jgi:HK97 gp10 family phage protein
MNAGGGLNITMQIIGGKELDAALHTLPIAVMRKVDKQGLKTAGEMVLNKAKQDCPVWSGVKNTKGEYWMGNTKAIPGLLRSSLKIVPGKRHKNYVSVGIGTAMGWLQGKTFYGGFVEFGTSKMGARPFVRPAFDTQRESILDRIITSINSALIKVWMSKSGTSTD